MSSAGHGVGLLDERSHAVLRFVAKRPRNRDELTRIFVDSKRAWWPEDLDRAISQLVDLGFAVDGDDGLVRRTVRSPL